MKRATAIEYSLSSRGFAQAYTCIVVAQPYVEGASMQSDGVEPALCIDMRAVVSVPRLLQSQPQLHQPPPAVCDRTWRDLNGQTRRSRSRFATLNHLHCALPSIVNRRPVLADVNARRFAPTRYAGFDVDTGSAPGDLRL
jgi:hypothetical protein